MRAGLDIASFVTAVGVACGLFGAGIGCGSSAGGPQNQDACAEPAAALEARARALADWPEAAPGLEVAVGWTPARADGVRVAFVDPDPTTRGEHAALALTVTPDCAVSLAPIAAVPIPIGAAGPVGPVIGDVDRDATRAALVVAGADFARAEELARWDAILDDLAVRGRALGGDPGNEPGGPAAIDPERADVATDRAAVEAAIADTCGEVMPGGLFLLVTFGRGGGGLVLGHDASGAAITLPWAAALAAVQAGCAHVGMVVWVVDAAGFDLEPPAGMPPMIVVRASDRADRDAARASAQGPGLLGAVLEARLSRRGDLCAGGRLEPAEIAALFADAATLRDELVAARWEAFGVPALARIEPEASEALQAELARAVPDAPIAVRGDLPIGGRCARDLDCAACALGTCERAICSRGICRTELHDGGPCDDGDACTSDDRCVASRCDGTPIACDDGNACTDEACQPGRGCVAVGVPGRACDDGDGCTHDDRCDDRGACAGAEVACDDGDPCTDDRCQVPTPGAPAECVFVPVNRACDDGDPCTTADQCRGQVCSGTARTCSDDNECTRDTCDAATGACRFDPVAELVGCDDGDPCTTLDRCREGACHGLASTCDDGLACTFDRCDEGACRHLPAPGTCLSPSGGECVAVGERPADAPCLVCAATDRLVPFGDDLPCDDDGLACTRDVCAAGSCVHLDAADACHDADGRCVAVGERVTDCLVCRGAGIVSAVEIGEACTSDACAFGACDGLGTCRCR